MTCRLDGDEKQNLQIVGFGPRGVTVINEAGLYSAIKRTLAQGRRVEIRGFGSFSLNYRPPRLGRNPKTGEKVSVPGKYVPHFKAGKELRELLKG